MSNIRGVYDKSSSNDDERKDGLEEFSVGGKTSTTAVYRPTTSDIIRKARGDTTAAAGGGDGDNAIANITLYANGFAVNDGAFHDTSDDSNQAFMKDLNEGNVPRRLEALLKEQGQLPKSRTISVNLVDKHTEHFKPKFDFRKTHGQSLGGASSSEVAGFKGATPRLVKVDPNAAKATVQVILTGRKRVREQFNMTHTVLDVYRHIMAVSGVQQDFKLMAGFPPKPLTDPSATVKDAKLHGASIEQRL